MTVNAWITASRPRTLLVSVGPVLVGSALAGAQFQWWIFGLCLLCAMLLQIATNLLNDVNDYVAGVDTDDRVGPTRAVQAGLLSVHAVRRAAYLCFALTLIVAAPLMQRGGVLLWCIGGLCVLAGWLYSSTSWSLSRTGLADVAVVAFFGVVATVGTHYLHALSAEPRVWWSGVALGLLALVVLILNNLRDHIGDELAGRKTTVVRFGRGFARGQLVFAYVIAYAIVSVIASGWSWLPLVTIPLAVRVIVASYHQSGPALNSQLAAAARLHFLFSITWSLGLLWERILH